MKLLSRLVFVPVAAIVVVFAVTNRQPVSLELWPFPFAVDLPLYLAVLGALVIGILIGGSAQWLSDGRWRRKARAGERRAGALARELSRSREGSAPAGSSAAAPSRTPVPRLGPRSPAR